MVITSALHAVGPQFDPGRDQIVFVISIELNLNLFKIKLPNKLKGILQKDIHYFKTMDGFGPGWIVRVRQPGITKAVTLTKAL